MGFLNTNSMPRLVEKLADGDNIKITGNSKGNRVGTVIKKIVEKADDVTKAIEQEVVNDGYSFKVGTGDVDVSADVEDGFGEVGVKGVTYQNILKGFDDGKWTGNHIEKNGNQCKLTQNSTSEYLRFRTDLIKKNTKYTLIYTVTENTMVDLSLCINGENVSSGENCIDSNMYIPNVLGTHIVTFTSSSLNDKTIKYFRFAIRSTTEDGTYVVLKNPILLEGDHTNNPNLPSYFEGIVGVGDKSKNLFDGALQQGYWYNGTLKPSTYAIANTHNIAIKPCTNYTFSIEGYDGIIYIAELDSGFNEIKAYQIKSKQSITTSNGSYLRFCTSNDELYKLSTNTKVQIEEGSIATSYQPYDTYKIEILSRPNLANISTSGRTNFEVGHIRKDKTYSLKFNREDKSVKYNLMYSFGGSNRKVALTDLSNEFVTFASTETCILYINSYKEVNITEIMLVEGIYSEETMPSFKSYQEDKTQILLDEPLMRLPNGVCDEITRDGKLIRKVGKKFIDANISELAHNGTSSNHNQFVIHKGVVTPNSINHANLLCDKKPCKVDNSGNNSVWVYNKATLVFQMDSTINSVEKMRQWLSQNPTTVYYELAEPVITELPAPYLRIFKDGHLTFNTLVAPESNHVVQLNKSAQIERSIREVQSLDGRVGQLESFYDDMMLETNHKLSLLNYDFEYTRERNGE